MTWDYLWKALAIIVPVISAQLIMHLQNRKEAKVKELEEVKKDNRLAFLLENFPPHAHDNHSGIRYPVGLDPRSFRQ